MSVALALQSIQELNHNVISALDGQGYLAMTRTIKEKPNYDSFGAFPL